VRQLRFRDSDPGVPDFHHCVLVLLASDYGDAAGLGRELDRIGEQIDQKLLELRGIGAHPQWHRSPLDLQFESFEPRQRYVRKLT
jgi:hypothetical protein